MLAVILVPVVGTSYRIQHEQCVLPGGKQSGQLMSLSGPCPQLSFWNLGAVRTIIPSGN